MRCILRYARVRARVVAANFQKSEALGYEHACGAFGNSFNVAIGLVPPCEYSTMSLLFASVTKTVSVLVATHGAGVRFGVECRDTLPLRVGEYVDDVAVCFIQQVGIRSRATVTRNALRHRAQRHGARRPGASAPGQHENDRSR